MKIATTTKIKNCQFSQPVDLGDGVEDHEYSVMDCTATTTVKTSTSTYPGITNGFTYGELVGSTWLFLIFLILIFSVAWFGFIKPNAVRNKQNSEI